uniref:Uncharacterized protein n=1 Tax=Romanomermis culicivorax TaxID=13658 RepID=A0A915KP08_ROMCU
MRVYSREELIDLCFQKAELENPLEYLDSIRDSAILALTNLTVDLLNLQILNAMPGGNNESLQAHSLDDSQLNVGDNVLESIHLRTPTGLLAHNLNSSQDLKLYKNISQKTLP